MHILFQDRLTFLVLSLSEGSSSGLGTVLGAETTRSKHSSLSVQNTQPSLVNVSGERGGFWGLDSTESGP